MVIHLSFLTLLHSHFIDITLSYQIISSIRPHSLGLPLSCNLPKHISLSFSSIFSSPIIYYIIIFNTIMFFISPSPFQVSVLFLVSPNSYQWSLTSTVITFTYFHNLYPSTNVHKFHPLTNYLSLIIFHL